MKKTVIALSIMILVSCGGGRQGNGVNILLVLIDTLRADHLHCYGYQRETSPYIDSLALTGTLYSHLQSQSSWTLPSMTTIFTGVSSRAHGAGRRNGQFYGMSPQLPNMPLYFHTHGYETAALINVIFMNEDFGFHRGFDYFNCQGFVSGQSRRKAGETVDVAIEWLNNRNTDKPFFMAIHFYDPHIPYDPPAPYNTLYTDSGYSGDYNSQWESITQMNAINSGQATIPLPGLDNLINLYDGEIAYTDNELGRLLAELRNNGIDENTIVVVIADHGEGFLEHNNIEHGVNLYQETVHVPLIISGPGIPSDTVINTPVTQMDIFPTLVKLAELPPRSGITGTYIITDPEKDRKIPASGVLWAPGELASITQGDIKVIWSVDTDSLEAYNLVEDPAELLPFTPDEELIEAVMYYWSTPGLVDPPLVSFGESMNRELRDLGYIR